MTHGKKFPMISVPLRYSTIFFLFRLAGENVRLVFQLAVKALAEFFG